MDADRECEKRDAFSATTATCKRSQFERSLDDENKSALKDADMALFRKIDIISFLAYLLGYILFNCYYWVSMNTKQG